MSEKYDYIENNALKDKIMVSLSILNELKTKSITFDVISIASFTAKNHLKKLFEVAEIFQKQLPIMPKNYIIHQVMNTKNNILILKRGDEIIGGVLYRPFYKQHFMEIVFLSVDNTLQVKGYGTLIMDILKEHVKREQYLYLKNELKVDDVMDEVLNPEIIRPNNIEPYLQDNNFDEELLKEYDCLHLMAYADNYAINFFVKQGFTFQMTNKKWVGYIKHYEGGTLMECRVDWKFNYILKTETIIKKKREFIKEFINKGMIKILTKEDIKNLPDEPEEKLERTQRLYNLYEYILHLIIMDPNAWAFIEPVNETDVPGYSKIIKTPMCLNVMLEKVEKQMYHNPQLFISDFKLIVSNCITFNGVDSVYTKSVMKLEQIFNGHTDKIYKLLLG